jgi:predicted HTH transcriptional regulator
MMRKECEAMNIPLPEYNVEPDRVEIVFRLPEKKEDTTGKMSADRPGLTEREPMIYASICERSVPMNANISKTTGLSFDTAKRTVKKLVEKGYLQMVGGNRFGKWVPVSRSN